jgi:NAD(P)-dependent dehydrogenase (short-subunit alcohol dehydrogenase family)
MSSVHGKVVLITGGANGIGAEVALRLHGKGATLDDDYRALMNRPSPSSHGEAPS